MFNVRLMGAVRLILSTLLSVAVVLPAQGGDQTFQVEVGPASMRLPVPPGFVEPSAELPELRKQREAHLLRSMRLLAFFIPAEDVQLRSVGHIPFPSRELAVMTPRTTDREALRKLYALMMQEPITAAYEAQKKPSEVLSLGINQPTTELDEAIRRRIMSLEVGATDFLGIFAARRNSTSAMYLLKTSSNSAESMTLSGTLMSVSHLQTQGTLFQLYVYSPYRSLDDLNWVRKATEDWLSRADASK